VFYLRTTLVVSEPDYPLSVEHDCIAVRVELVRLWLLFLPTFAAVAFLLVTFAKGTTWKFSLLDRFWEAGSYPIFLGIRAFQVIVVGLLSTWVCERWVLRDADACSAASVSMMASHPSYSFKDRCGEYYGGEGFPFALVRSSQLARIVFYRSSKPQLNKISSGCLFHRLAIVGRGVTGLGRGDCSHAFRQSATRLAAALRLAEQFMSNPKRINAGQKGLRHRIRKCMNLLTRKVAFAMVIRVYPVRRRQHGGHNRGGAAEYPPSWERDEPSPRVSNS
jgi:hypothetical protein